jgi:hypothetical protein
MTEQHENIAPSDRNAILLLADDCREETGGKMTLLGYMPGAVFEVGAKAGEAAPSAPDVLQSLAVIMVFPDGGGEFTLRVSLIDPNGKDRFQGVAPQAIKKALDGPMNVILAIKPFPVVVGDYKLSIHLDDYEYNRLFKVRRQGA